MKQVNVKRVKNSRTGDVYYKPILSPLTGAEMKCKDGECFLKAVVFPKQ